MAPEQQTEQQDHAWVRRAAGAAMLGAAAAGVVATVGAEPAAAYEHNPDGTITLERGDNLWDITQKETGAHGADLIQKVHGLTAENHVANPTTLMPGQKLSITSLHPEVVTPSETYTLKYGDTLWDAVKEHYGYVTASLVDEVARSSGINTALYFPGEVVKFPSKQADAPAAPSAPTEVVAPEPDTKVTITSQNQTMWALANFVAAANHVPHAQALQMTMDANPGVVPQLIQAGDKITLPGVSDTEMKQMIDAIVHYSHLQQTVPRGSATVPESVVTVAAEQPQNPQQLAQAVLANPNITIQSSPNDRVRKSIENVEDNGATFTHDVGASGEVQVSSRLLQVVQAISKQYPLTITSLTTGEHSPSSDHYKGEAVDLGIDGNSPTVFKLLYDNREAFGVDELIWATPPDGAANLKNGQPYAYSPETLAAHGGENAHIHVSFGAKDPLPKPEAPPTPEAVAPQNTYILGDSISEGLHQAGLEEKLQAKLGGQVMIDFDSGRSITRPGTEKHQSALDAVDADQEYIKGSKNIVVVLGTNPTDNPFAENLQALIAKLKALAPDAKYYVVDIGATRADTVGVWNERNKIIYDNAETLGYTVISRAKALFGDGTDPTNLPAGADIPGGGDDVHGGYDKLAAALTWVVGNEPQPPAPECVTSPELVGADNPEKIYNYLVMKGLSPHQAAGVMGNLQAESGFEPGRVQYGGTNSRGERSVAGQPSSIDGTMRIDGRTGYGIAQWTSQGRQQGLHDFAVSRGTSDGDLATQLDWLYKEATERGDWAKLEQAGDAGQAAFLWHKYYEISADGPERVQNRMNFAQDILTRYQSLTPPKAC